MPNDNNLQVMRRIRLPYFQWSKLPVAWLNQKKQTQDKTPEEKQLPVAQFFLVFILFIRFIIIFNFRSSLR